MMLYDGLKPKCMFCGQRNALGYFPHATGYGYLHYGCKFEFYKQQEEKMKIKTLQVDSKLMHEYYEENKDCKTVRDFCETLWPDEFKVKEEWEDITQGCRFELRMSGIGKHWFVLSYNDIPIINSTWSHTEIFPLRVCDSNNYKLEIDGAYFRILKRKDSQ